MLSLSNFKLPGGGIDLEDGDIDSIQIDSGEISFDQVQQSKDLRGHLLNVIQFMVQSRGILSGLNRKFSMSGEFNDLKLLICSTQYKIMGRPI